MTTDEAKKAIRRLTRAQRAAFDRLCCNEQGGHPRVLSALVAAGLAEPYETALPSWPGPVHITNYIIPIPVHIAWAELCSAEVEDGR